ncbi:MAG: hypothetical protein JXQ99_04015 [Hyphomicrobiaceae bacterium]
MARVLGLEMLLQPTSPSPGRLASNVAPSCPEFGDLIGFDAHVPVIEERWRMSAHLTLAARWIAAACFEEASRGAL